MSRPEFLENFENGEGPNKDEQAWKWAEFFGAKRPSFYTDGAILDKLAFLKKLFLKMQEKA